MDYTNYDYNALVTAITEALAEKEGWGEGYQSSTGQMLIQLFADTTDALLYMLERRSQEGFISTAMLDTSIYAHASELGYRPRRVVAMTGTLQIDLLDAQGNSLAAIAAIEIPKYTKISLASPAVDFVTIEDVTIPVGATTATIPVKEGIYTTKSVNSDGIDFSSNDVVFSDYRFIDEYSIEVLDSGELYYDVEKTDVSAYSVGALSYASSTDPVYDIKYSMEGMRIVFGDDVFGKKPSGTVTVNYVESQNVSSSILSTGINFVFESQYLTDSSNTIPETQYFYNLTNITPIRGYTEPESIIDIAKNAPEYARANNRGVTGPDYRFLAIRSGIGGIGDASVYGEQETDSLIFYMNHINLAYITTDAIEMNVEQQVQLREHLDKYKIVTTHISLEEAKKIEAILTVKHKRNSKLPISDEELYKVLKASIDDFFVIEAGSINKDLHHSDLITHIQETKYTANNITYNITDYVKVDIKLQYQMSNPVKVFDIRVTLDENYVINAGDIWRITLDGTNFDVTVLAGDTVADIAERMRILISDGTFFITSIEGAFNNTIRITSKYTDYTFPVDTTGGDLNAITTTDIVVTIPSYKINNPAQIDVVVRGSCSIVDSSEVALYIDDGNGNLVHQSGGQDITIDYANMQIENPVFPDINETYYFRFSQDEFQNMYTAENNVIVLSPFADEITDTALYSTITLV